MKLLFIALLSLLAGVTCDSSEISNTFPLEDNVVLDSPTEAVASKQRFHYRLFVYVDEHGIGNKNLLQEILQETNMITSNQSNIHLQITGFHFSPMPEFGSDSYTDIASRSEQTAKKYEYDLFVMLYNDGPRKDQIIKEKGCHEKTVQTISIRKDQSGNVDRKQTADAIAQTIFASIRLVSPFNSANFNEELKYLLNNNSASVSCLRRNPVPKETMLSIIKNGIIEDPEECDCHAHEFLCDETCLDGRTLWMSTPSSPADTTAFMNGTHGNLHRETTGQSLYGVNFALVVLALSVSFLFLFYVIYRTRNKICSGRHVVSPHLNGIQTLDGHEGGDSIRSNSEVSDVVPDKVFKGMYTPV